MKSKIQIEDLYKSSAFQQASSEYSYLSFTCKDRGIPHIVKPVVRCHFWDKERWPYKTGDLLKEVQFI
jgi:hypothetical protein